MVDHQRCHSCNMVIVEQRHIFGKFILNLHKNMLYKDVPVIIVYHTLISEPIMVEDIFCRFILITPIKKLSVFIVAVIPRYVEGIATYSQIWPLSKMQGRLR